jgi:hypothetical protein
MTDRRSPGLDRDPLMDQHDDGAHPLRVDLRQECIYRTCFVGEGQASDAGGRRHGRRSREHDADEGDADVLAAAGIELFDCVRREERLPRRLISDVRGEVRIFCSAEGPIDQTRVAGVSRPPRLGMARGAENIGSEVR